MVVTYTVNRCLCHVDLERKRTRSPDNQTATPALVATDTDAQPGSDLGPLIEAASPSDFEEDEFQPSDYDEASMADSTSIGSSIYSHSFHNGRRYHKACLPYRHGRYPIPNDEIEQNREDMLHAMMMEVTDGKLFYAPVSEYPQKILDLGTGTGIWAMEVGDMFPSAQVTGLDLSPIQPIWVPPNVKFVVDDVEDEWCEGDNHDFVHLRNMIPILKSPTKLLRDVYNNLKPGGWVELQDVDGAVHCDDQSIPDDWPISVFCNLMVEAFAKLGTTSHAAMLGREYLEQAGFVNIMHHTAKLPYGTWPKDKTMRLVGHYYRLAAEEFFPAMGAIQMPLLGWSKPEIEVFFAQCRNAMRDDSVHAYGLMHFWSGQKPENAA
ncbi:S-adenosyl-L-methionine-dependent methyltransferase [Truncatella angustata]|uniref:S-adenosyl-L-methionine-dependent methyltransferase n=1 Tax=Truncatella angustata TaxID=152316 RepID=A0A9P8RG91_9PEZI|nr:S-adenosyl-L-methionine-dependent methyltransferase [Truncatella angustata]KAH6645254.1 S-adenosyl-L-methionine-dependent methyltransferase [Truncatella angustata]